MRGRRIIALGGLIVAALLALSMPSLAGAAVSTLTANPDAMFPDIAVDDDGTSHIVWLDRKATNDEDVVYCRLPRGAGACAATRAFGLKGTAGPPKVNLMPTGELVITSERFGDDPGGTDPDNKVYAMTSNNDGGSFSAPKVIANRDGTIWGWSGEVEPGPGNFSLSLYGNSGGCNQRLNYSAAPLDGFTTTAAELTDICGKVFEPSVAFVDPTTPIVAHSGGAGGQPSRIYFRRWGGAGNYNSAATWGPEQSPFAGSEPRLAGGLRGAFLIFKHPQVPFEYRVSRFNPASGGFGPAQVVSGAGDGQSAFERDLIQDGGGTLHAVFRERPEGSQTWELRHRISRDGATWDPIETLARDGRLPAGQNFFNVRAGAAPDGGGGIVSDDNGGGPIRFVPFDPSGGSGSCPTAIKVGGAIARSLEGCFEKKKGGTRLTNGPVKLNGIDIEPDGGGGAENAAAFSVKVDRKARTLKTTAKASVRAGAVLLDRSKLAWKLPAGTGAVKGLGGGDKSAFEQIDKYAKKLFEFPVKGDAELLIGKGETASIPTSFGLPGLIGGVSGAVTLRTDKAGLDLDGLKIKTPEAAIGLLRIGKIDVSYKGQNRFSGSATLELPPAYGGPFTVGFGFLEGRLNRIHYDMPFQPMLPIVAPPFVGAPPQPLVGLEDLAIDYVDEEGSRKLIGAVGIVGGGSYAGLRAAELEGNVALEFPSSGPATISARGNLDVISVPFATGGIDYSTDGLLSFDGSFAFPPAGKWQSLAAIKAGVDGWVSVADPVRFSAQGGATAKVGPISGSGQAVISSKGVSGCVTFPQPPPPADVIPDLGISYAWGATFPTPACNVGSFKIPKPAATTAGLAESADAAAVQIGGGLPQAALEISGAGGAPRVKVTAPDGSTVTSGNGSVADGRFIATEFPEADKTYVSIGKPPAGRYLVETLGGSAQITTTRLANGIPDAKVSAKLRGKGRKRTLRFSARRIAGQRITFAEQSSGGLYREFATTGKSRGTVKLRPANSKQRRRRIIALVEQDGLPRARLALARFKGPKYRPAARPRKLRARRRGSRLLVSWRPVKGAKEYRVRVSLPKDGRKVLRYVKGKRRPKLKLAGLERNDRGRITVEAIGADAQPGKTAKAKLKPEKKRKGKGKRKKKGRR